MAALLNCGMTADVLVLCSPLPRRSFLGQRLDGPFPSATTPSRPCLSLTASQQGAASSNKEMPGGPSTSRRMTSLSSAALLASTSGVGGWAMPANAVSARRAAREVEVPESEYKTLPNGLKIYDVKVGKGPIAAQGVRVAIHYIAKWKGLTFQTSRQGLGINGGSPYGFDIGSSASGIVLKGLDFGTEGMRVGGERLLIVPPRLAYGSRGVQEIPPNATLNFNVELLSIKQDAFGSRVNIVEG